MLYLVGESLLLQVFILLRLEAWNKGFHQTVPGEKIHREAQQQNALKVELSLVERKYTGKQIIECGGDTA